MEKDINKIFTGERFVPGIQNAELSIEHFQRYESIVELVKDKIVVDAACGEGYGSSILGNTARSVLGIDISPEAVTRAEQNYGTESVSFRVGSVENLPVEDNSVDVFVSFETIEHVDQNIQEKFVKEVARVLKKDGMFIVSSPNKEIYSDLFDYHNEFHVHEMYKEEFSDLLHRNFKNVNLYNQYFEVASVIDNNDIIENKAIYKKNRETYKSDGKYYIAVASNGEISDIVIQSVYLSHDVVYRANISRILQLQEAEEARNRHIAYLDKERQDILDVLIEKDRQIMELTAMNAVKDQHIVNFRRGYDKWMKVTAPYHFAKRKARGLLCRAGRLKKNLLRKKIVFPYFEHPKVSIIIPVYNQFEYTWDCLRSIYDNTKDISYEIIIGDDGSTDRTLRLGIYAKGIKIIRNTENLRFLRNCNNAAKEARGDYIFFLNNDTQVTTNWLSSLVELIESDPKIGMVGSKLVYPDGSLQEAGGIIWNDASGWNYGRNDDASKPEYNYVREVDYISGAAIMIRHTLWNEIGGFDELFVPAYCEDSDLAFEVRKKGYKVMYQPKSVVIHFEGISNGTDVSSGVKKYQIENSQKFKEKWKNELAQHYENSQVLFRARERNFDKKVILIVDHYVPTFDKDAGSKTTFQYIKMFLKKGYIVKFIGDNFNQMEPYTSILQQMGVEVLYGTWYAEHIFEWIAENQEHIHVAYLNRPHITEKYIHFFSRKTNIKIIYYGHDLGYLREEREAQVTGNQELFEMAERSKKKELGILREAEMSYYPSQIEIDAIHEIDPQIPVKAITAYVFDEFQEDFRYVPEEREGILFVGGFSHGPNIDAVKWFVNDIYPMIREKEGIPFYIVGSNAPKELMQLSGNGVVFKGFVSEEELEELYHKTKIVVVPLRFGAGVKGKVVEALYYGTPLVTTDVGAEGIVGIEDVAIIKDGEQELAEEILELYHDNDKLNDMAQKSRSYIRDHFSIDAAWKVIEEDFA